MKNAFHKRNHNISYKAIHPKHMESVMRKQLQKMLDCAKKTNESRKLLAPFSHLKESLLTRSTEMKPEYVRQVSLNSSDWNADSAEHEENNQSKSHNDDNDDESNCIFDDLIQDCCDFVENQDGPDEEEYYDNMYFNIESHEYVPANTRATYHSSSASQVQPRFVRKGREDTRSHDYLDERKERNEFNQHLRRPYSNEYMSEKEQCTNNSSDSCVLYYYDSTSNVRRSRTYNEQHA